ncbi:MAG: glycerol-3-phosphate 1-O-acyltransferase PlsY [Kiritimatiellae bacterium]|nr:glycerol-3-phosphate 1-O-acyltransferase PlsY [Kiritimatiellia bacterium]MDW8457830.1 glycerol-3-phosphate 1-O-acyltransferase PlsY [Verrucomicrobiota bacterium]
MSGAATWILLVVASYLLGAIPFGFLIARAKGVDIRKVGSGNIGATNVLRSVGKPWGILTFVLDALKGFIPAMVFPYLGSRWGADFHSMEIARLAGGVAAVVGHSFPVYLRFRGGKGVATSAGALLGIAPLAGLAGLCVWGLLFFAFKYVSLASIGAAVAVPVAAWLLYRSESAVVPAALTMLAILVVYRHRDNIRRLASGTEHRFGQKREV